MATLMVKSFCRHLLDFLLSLYIFFIYLYYPLYPHYLLLHNLDKYFHHLSINNFSICRIRRRFGRRWNCGQRRGGRGDVQPRPQGRHCVERQPGRKRLCWRWGRRRRGPGRLDGLDRWLLKLTCTRRCRLAVFDYWHHQVVCSWRFGVWLLWRLSNQWNWRFLL